MELNASGTGGLVIFDIDGTLTKTNAVDCSCYARAVEDVLGVSGFSTDWGDYRHSTDVGILEEIVATRCGRVASQRDVRSVRRRFIELVEEERRRVGGFEEVDGAAEMLRALPALGWRCAIATGGWEPSARCKLESAGIGSASAALATAEDAFARTDIIAWAIRRAATAAEATRMARVYVGDGRWDVEAARASGCGFVGIGHGERASRLVGAGAKAVLPDFRDQARFVKALHEASVEQRAR